ncbi:MAG: tetratricopeptide repeat protein [Oscillospiraceae bacterium]|nr:tetratricopeptide repeat protein [Oscillospiraceae bacterium]
MNFEYDVFFSYRHRPLDGEITQKVFNLIESYRLPHTIREEGYADIRRAFRDTEELPVSRILTDTIDKALRSTNCLIVVCSTDTPSSEWIDREVAVFIDLGRADHIYPLLISGDPGKSFPPSLKTVPDIMDRVMDIRLPGSPVKKMMSRAETEILRAVAGITGCGEAELIREHMLRKNRRFAARAAAGAALFVLIAGISLGLMKLARDYRDTAVRQETASMRILNELTYSLPDHLTNIPGAYSRIAGILESNTEDINMILQLSTDRESAEFEAAANYEKLANASDVLGKFDRALTAQEEAITRYRKLQAAGAEGSTEKLASAFNNRGRILSTAGRYEEAGDAFTEAIALYEQEGGRDLFLAQLYKNAGINEVDRGDTEAASEAFEESLRILDGLEEDIKNLEESREVCRNYGIMLYRTGDFPGAEEKLRASGEAGKRLLEQIDSLQYRSDYTEILNALATVLTDEGKYDEADSCYEAAIKNAEELAQDAENTNEQRTLGKLYNNRALSLNIRGDYIGADEMYRHAAEVYEGISGKTGAVPDQIMTALTFLNLGENAFKLHDYGTSRDYFEKGLMICQGVLDEMGDYDRAQYEAWSSYYLLIHQRNYTAALEAAIRGFALKPDNVLINMNLAYACLYCGYWEDADRILCAVAALGEGQAETIRRDLAAQEEAGLGSEHLPELLALLDETGAEG